MTMRIRRSSRVLLALACLALVLPFTPARAANLILNPGFESTYLPAQVMQLQRQAGVNQPVWPTNWAAEGLTELFDHTGWHFRSGRYSAQISGSWSGPRSECSVPPCQTLPGGAERDQVYGTALSAQPAWRTDLPIAVTAGRTYTLSAYTKLQIPLANTGAVTWVRWYNSAMVPIGYSAGPKLLAAANPRASYKSFAEGTFADLSTDWTFITGTVRAPTSTINPALNAAFATVFFGYSDSAWIGSVMYDDVFFG